MTASHGITLGSAPLYIAATPENPKEIHHISGGVVYHKTADDVDSGDTELAEDASVQITEGNYFIAATTATVVVRELTAKTFEDVTTVDDLTVGDDLKVEGAATIDETATVTKKLTASAEVEIDGDLNHDGEKAGFCGAVPVVPPEVAKEEAEEKKATVAELQEALEELGLIKEKA